jgi:alpha-L-fucosidase
MNLYPHFDDSMTRPSPAQLRWQRMETNLFVHFGLNTFTGREWGDGTESPALFNPAGVDCAQWARVAREGGFKIVILTAKHHDGFCLWPSRLTDYSVASSPWREGRGDLVREFVDACRAEGLKVGLYLSPWDRHEPCYGDSQRYNDFYCGQLTELLTGYGELHEVWFDGACGEGPNGRRQAYDWARYFSLVKALQPGAVTFGDGGTDVRWVGNERGFAGETCWSTVDPSRVKFPGDSGICEANDAKANAECARLLNEGEEPVPGAPRVWRPAECDVSIRPGWFYHADQDARVRTVDNLVELFFQSVGRNGVLLLNLPPTPEGVIHEIDATRVKAMRARLDAIFAVNLARRAEVTINGQSGVVLVDANPDTFWQAAPDGGPAEIELRFAEAQTIDVLELKEAVGLGQRIASWRIERRTAEGGWELLITGTTVGYRRLLRLPVFATTGLRIVLDRSWGPPALCGLGVYADSRPAATVFP